MPDNAAYTAVVVDEAGGWSPLIWWLLVAVCAVVFVVVDAQSDIDRFWLLAVAIPLWLIFLEKVPSASSEFVARKCCHAGCGCGIMLMDTTDLRAKVFVWIVALSTIMMTWGLSPLPTFRFLHEKDIGGTLYLTLVSVWFAVELPILILAPVFFADPAGAVVGKYFTRNFPKINPKWYEEKSVLGSLAVLLFTFSTIAYACTLPQRLVVAFLAMLGEALGGDYDNLVLAVVILGGWQVTAWINGDPTLF